MITLSNLDFGYSANKNVLNQININLPEGHIYGLLGENGVGKSTLLGVITGLFKAEGECKIDDIPSHDKPIKLLQELFLMNDEVTFVSSAKSTAEFYEKLYPHFDMKYFLEIADKFKIDINVKRRKLSLGSARKAYIALALACNTRYLLMDEPTNGLDITSKAIFRQLIAAHATPERTIIISTHQVDDVEDLLDSIIIMKDSEVLLSATTSEIGEKLCFGQLESDDEPLFYKDSVNGRVGIAKNISGIEMPIDVKMLFMACMENPEGIKEIMNK